MMKGKMKIDSERSDDRIGEVGRKITPCRGEAREEKHPCGRGKRSDRWQGRRYRGKEDKAALRYDLNRGIGGGVRPRVCVLRRALSVESRWPFSCQRTHTYTLAHTLSSPLTSLTKLHAELWE